ncbi:hypothetical protein [uncultured Clostridium sp.]|uniref:hypothetical protein n=1 Tax=uncultured Clostridium sp. TaxID=59620 RepID=UPI0026EA3543|nr:hypothetical protein [uncultured Clostridium sp.]
MSILDLKMRRYCIPLESFNKSDKSYDFLLKNSFPINIEVKDIIDMFLNKIITLNTMPNYIVSPEWGEAANNYRIRFVIITHNSDFIFVPIKLIAMMKVKYATISHEPISLNGNNQNIIDVLEVLKDFDIQYIMTIENEQNDKDYYMNNYYCVKDVFYNSFQNRKHNARKGNKKLGDILTYHTERCTPELLPKFKEFIDMWHNDRGKEGSPTKVDINLINMNIDNIGDVIVNWVTYKDKIIGYVLCCVSCNKYVMELCSKTLAPLPIEVIANYLNEDIDGISKTIKTYFGGYFQYMITKNFLIDNDYIAHYAYGDVKTKSLQTYKIKYYKGIIYQYKTDLQEYIKRLKEQI